jgi:proteic killer suppression protein
LIVIASFGDVATEALYHGGRVSRFLKIPSEIRDAALRKMDVLDAAVQLDELKSPPGNHLEALAGNLAGFHSIRINRQWRLIFRWRDGDAYEVAIVDYH